MQGFLPVLVWEMETRVGGVGSGVEEMERERDKDDEVVEGRVAHSAGQPRPQAEDGVPRVGTSGNEMGWRRLEKDIQLT